MDSTRKSIVIVDDEPMVTDIFPLVLKMEPFIQQHYDIKTFNCPLEAFECMKLIQIQGGITAALVTDNTMAGLTGLELAQRAKQQLLQPLLVMIMAGEPIKNLEFVDGFIQKPFQPQDVLTWLVTELKKQQSTVYV